MTDTTDCYDPAVSARLIRLADMHAHYDWCLVRAAEMRRIAGHPGCYAAAAAAELDAIRAEEAALAELGARSL